MGLTTAGRDFIAQAIINDSSPVFFTNAVAALGVGDSSLAFTNTQTDLQAATNHLKKAMDSTYPQRTGNVITAKSTWGDTYGEWHWWEWGFFNSVTAATGTMLNRAVSDMGTKAAGSTWVLTATITITAA
jgi:hypothetical protein